MEQAFQSKINFGGKKQENFEKSSSRGVVNGKRRGGQNTFEARNKGKGYDNQRNSNGVTLTLLALFAKNPIMHPKIAYLNARDAKFLIILIEIVGSIMRKTKLIFQNKMNQNNSSRA